LTVAIWNPATAVLGSGDEVMLRAVGEVRLGAVGTTLSPERLQALTLSTNVDATIHNIIDFIRAPLGKPSMLRARVPTTKAATQGGK
jgi:hypothetical protein